MNCQDCKEHLIEYIEELLEGQQARAIASHLADCPTCRTEAARMTDLRKRLIQNGQAFAETDLENAVFDQIVRSQHLKFKEIRKTNRQFNLWRIIMKSRITKFATAAAVILIAVLGITFLEESTQTAYAIEQTIQASHTVRYLHIKDFKEGMEEPKEFWLEFDAKGSVENIRAFMPEWESPSDGAKVVIWRKGKAKVWFKKKKSLVTIRDKRFADEMLKTVQLFDPKLALQIFLEWEKHGLVTIEIDEPSKKTEPIAVTSTNSSKVKEIGYRVDRTVILIDQATKLITAIEHYHLIENGDYELLGWTEFYDYNQQIDPTMFVLEGLPSDVMQIDQTTQEIGLVQGNMTDKEIAVEVVRQFYQAVIAKDYAKAGQLLEGLPDDRMKEMFEELNVIRIVSIGEPVPHPIPGVGGFRVPCKLEIEEDGIKSIYEPYGPGVRRVHGQPHRWDIHGGVK